tara:strand:- start:139 stop:1038 length:900 start_codon:yes stop_codon:yes gene_type:complete
MSSTSEIDMLLELKKSQERPVSTNTLDKYKSQYNYLTKTNNYTGDWVTETGEKELIELIKSLNIKSSGRLGYLNVLMLIKQLKNQPVNSILKYRDSLFKENDVDTAVKIKEKQNQNLPTYNEIDYFINQLYKEGDWIRFLYNYLIFTYALRNKDANLEIISADKFKKLSTENKINKNYLVVKKTECELVVDNYKTKSCYGTKHIKIRSRKVLKACQLLGDGLLLKKTNNEPVGDTELSYYLKLYMNQDFHLTEADYFKINLLYIQTQPNCINRLNELCNSRGSKSIGCIDKYYNLCEDN